MTTKISLKTNGPIRVEGEFELLDGQGNTVDLNGRTAISLCRCGASDKKPFCDGAHSKCEFKSEVVTES